MRPLCGTILLLALVAAPGWGQSREGGSLRAKKIEADPTATALLAEARAARATWHHFHGFKADLEVNFDGKVFRGPVEVSPQGKVTLTLGDRHAETWARHTLGSVVAHRLDNSTELK